MNRDELEKIVIAAIQKFQELSGENDKAITARTCPIKDLTNFDSLRGLEVSSQLAVDTGCDFSDNVFVSEDGTRALTISEIVLRVERKLEGGRKRKS